MHQPNQETAMPAWPITFGLGQGGPASLCLDGLKGGGMALNPRRVLIPIFPSGYAGRDFPPLSVLADDAFAIDLRLALDSGDRLDADSLQTLFFPVDVPASDFAAALDGPPILMGTLAAQAIGRPPAGRYALGFSCRTVGGRTVQIHSFFDAVGLPDAA
jgi:hypothetical protein